MWTGIVLWSTCGKDGSITICFNIRGCGRRGAWVDWNRQRKMSTYIAREMPQNEVPRPFFWYRWYGETVAFRASDVLRVGSVS